jgi:hypothetical protein
VAIQQKNNTITRISYRCVVAGRSRWHAAQVAQALKRRKGATSSMASVSPQWHLQPVPENSEYSPAECRPRQIEERQAQPPVLPVLGGYRQLLQNILYKRQEMKEQSHV